LKVIEIFLPSGRFYGSEAGLFAAADAFLRFRFNAGRRGVFYPA